MRGSEFGNRYSPTGTEILTRSGQMIDLLNPRPEQIRMSDIAYSLAGQRRFTAHCPLRPTIAEHSLAVEQIARKLLADFDGCYPGVERCSTWRALSRAALMHDAAEYLVGDATGAVKKLMRQLEAERVARVLPIGYPVDDESVFDQLEAGAQAAIVERFDCAATGWEEIIHEADCLACAYEMSDGGWCADAQPPEWVARSYALWFCYNHGDGGVRAFLARAAELGMVDDA